MATHLPVIGGHAEGFAQTTRTDDWRSGPAITFLVFMSFVIYTAWAGLQGNHYYFAPYLSPYYAPVLFSDPSVAGALPVSHAWFGAVPSWWPSKLISFSPALVILVFPGSFRFTWYYYRKAYYRSFAGSPPGCAVGPLAGKRRYRGETQLMLFQNLHRYAMYFALVFIPLLSKEAISSFFRDGVFGVGVGSLLLTTNAVLIAAYTLGCHSFRHMIGGRKDCMSACGKPSLALGTWKKATWFNMRHMQFAWASLVWVMITDLYVRLCSMGVIHDFNTW
jgi:hypothetical protein